jgi:hypothetical protein
MLQNDLERISTKPTKIYILIMLVGVVGSFWLCNSSARLKNLWISHKLHDERRNIEEDPLILKVSDEERCKVKLELDSSFALIDKTSDVS